MKEAKRSENKSRSWRGLMRYLASNLDGTRSPSNAQPRIEYQEEGTSGVLDLCLLYERFCFWGCLIICGNVLYCIVILPISVVYTSIHYLLTSRLLTPKGSWRIALFLLIATSVVLHLRQYRLRCLRCLHRGYTIGSEGKQR